jgi:hypothetical protein
VDGELEERIGLAEAKTGAVSGIEAETKARIEKGVST